MKVGEVHKRTVYIVANVYECNGEVVEISDWLAVTNREYKQGTMELYQILSLLKRRRIEKSSAELASVTYLAHPYAKNNGLRLLDDIYGDKILSLQSLATDIDDVVNVSKNAVSRPKIKLKEFDEEYDGV